MADEPPPPPTETANISTPAAQNTEETRSWEKSWTLEEIRKGSGNWSLAGDSGLLLHLQEFSQKMISRTHEIEKEVATLVHDTKLASVRVNNVFNDFVMLADTQFVENRVYDDNPEEVTQEETQDEKKPDNQEKTREEKEKELIPRVTEAIQLGVDVIEKAFEKLDTNVDNSDSEEEDESYRVDPILEAKDPYLDRPLPYLIGTPNFLNDDNVGLKDMSDDESEHDSYSESESEDEIDKRDKDSKGDDSEYSYSDSESGSDTPAPRRSRVISKSDEESDSDGDLFSEKQKDSEDSEESDDEEEEEEEQEQKPSAPAAPLDFASELSRKLGGAPPAPVAEDQGSSEDEAEEKVEKKSKQKGKKKKEKERSRKKSGSKTKEKARPKDDDDLFKQDDDSDDDLFGAAGTFGGGGGVFDKGDSDEGGLFDDDSSVKHKPQTADTEEEEEEEVKPVESKKRTRTTSSGKKIPAGAVSVFGGESKQKGGGGGGLFDDDEEDDLFGSSQSQKKEETKKETTPKGGGLFEEDDDDNDGDDIFNKKDPEPQPEKVEKKSPKKKLPAGAVSMFGPGANPLAAALKKQRQDSDKEEDDNDWSDGEKSRTGSLKSNQSNASKHSSKLGSAQSKDSLLTGDPDDSAFVGKPKSNSFSKNAKATKGLFDDEDEDDLFGSTTSKAPQKKTESKAKSTMLFQDDDDNEGDLFSSMKPAEPEKKKPPPGAVSIFPTGSDPFAKKKETVEKEVKKVEDVRRPPARSISLFDDNQQDEDLFEAGPPKQPPQKQTTEANKKSVFDDDGLFGEDDSGDIFDKPPSPTKTITQPSLSKPDTRTSITQVAKPKATKAVKGPDLFGEGDGDDDDGDLFGSGFSQAPKKTGSVDIGGATTTESTDTLDKPEEPSEPAIKQKKPPVGGVSMFGPGSGPLILPNKNKSKDVEEKPKQEEKKEVKKKAGDALFGGDDEDDLFGGPPKSKTVMPPKQEVKKTVEKPASSNGPLSLGDDDDLFSGTVKKPEKQKVEPVKQQTKPRAGPLQLDDDDGGDLFAAPPKLPGAKAKPEPVKESKTSPLDDDDDDDDDMFSGGKTEPPKLEETPPPEEPVKRKPVGGVSMFGGMDPFAAKKKPSPPKETTPDLSSPDEDLFSSADEANLNFNPAAMLPGAAPPIKEPEPLEIGFDVPVQTRTLHSANKDRAKIQTKRRPPSRHARKSAASLSPASPTDDFFSPNAVSAEIDIDPSRVPPPLSDSPGTDKIPSGSNHSSARVSSLDTPDSSLTSSKTADLFGNEDLFGGAMPKLSSSKTVMSSTETDFEKNSPDDIFSSNAFGGTKSKSKKEDVNDLFSSPKLDTRPSASATSSVPNDDLFDSVPKTKQTATDSAKNENVDIPNKKAKQRSILDDDDDLFSSPSLSKPKDSGKKPVNNSVAEDDVFTDSSLTKTKATPKPAATEDNTDDLLSAPKLEKKKPKKAMTKDEDLFEDDTDIFSDIPKAKPKEKKVKKKTTTAAPKKTIFKDDIDDIFADTSASGKPKEKEKKKKKTAAKDTSKKADRSDDIFSDPLS